MGGAQVFGVVDPSTREMFFTPKKLDSARKIFMRNCSMMSETMMSPNNCSGFGNIGSLVPSETLKRLMGEC